MSTVLSSMVSIFNTNNTAIIAPKKRSSLFSRMFGATDVSTSTPKKQSLQGIRGIRGRYESDDESEYESGDDDDAFDMLPSDDTHSGERLYTLSQRSHYHSDTLSFSFTKSDSPSQHYLTPCGGDDLPPSLSAPTLFRKVSSEIKRSLGLKRSPGTQSTPNFLGGAILPEGSTPPPALLPEQSPPKHWLGAKRFPGLKRDPSTSSKKILDFEMPKRASLRTQSTLHFQEEYESMPMAKDLKTQKGLRTQSCLDFEEEFAAWDDEEDDSLFSLSESEDEEEEKPAPKSMKRMLISFKAERERVVIWNTVSIESLPDSYKFNPGDVVYLGDGETVGTIIQMLEDCRTYRVQLRDSQEVRDVCMSELEHCIKIIVKHPSAEQVEFFETCENEMNRNLLKTASCSFPCTPKKM